MLFLMIILTGASAGDAWPTLFSANHMSIVSTLQRRESSAAVTGDTDSEEGCTGLSLEVEASGDTLQIVYHTQRCNELVDYVECGIVGALESSSEPNLSNDAASSTGINPITLRLRATMRNMVAVMPRTLHCAQALALHAPCVVVEYPHPADNSATLPAERFVMTWHGVNVCTLGTGLSLSFFFPFILFFIRAYD